MASLYQTLKSCVYKTPVSEQVVVVTKADAEEKTGEEAEGDEVQENADPTAELISNKKTDEMAEPQKQVGVVWRMSSGIYSTAAGAVGYGVGGVRWVAGKSYNVGSAVVSHVKVPSIKSLKRKDKKE